jgi:hypothetical protein
MDRSMLEAAQKVLQITEARVMELATQLERAPIAVVEYDGTFPGESKRAYDARREIETVYSSNPKTLVKHLKTYKSVSTAGMLPWEIIFTFYKIVNPTVVGSVSEAESSNIVSEQSVVAAQAGEPVYENEDHTSVATAKTEGSSAATELDRETVTEEHNIQLNKEEVIADEDSEPTYKGSTVNTSKDPTQGTAMADDQKCTTTLKESIIMDGQNNQAAGLEGIINGVANELDAAKGAVETPKTTKSGKSGKPETVSKEISDKALEQVKASIPARRNFTKTCVIKNIIAAQPSVKSRIINTANLQGRVIKDGVKPESIAEEVDKKLKAHIAHAIGRQFDSKHADVAMGYDEWNKLTDDEKYKNIVPDTLPMFKQIISALVELKSNPNKMFALAMPEKDNYSYKGLQLSDPKFNLISRDDLARVISNNALDKLVGEGMLTDDLHIKPQFITSEGKVSKDYVEAAAKIAKLTERERTALATSKQPTGAVSTTKLTVQLKGRQALYDAGKVVFIFSIVNKDPQTAGSASLTVLLDGKQATYKYYLVDSEGNRVNYPQKDATTPAKPKIGTGYLKGSAPVYSVKKEYTEEFKGDRTQAQADQYWDVKAKTETDVTNPFAAEADQLVIFKAATQVNVLGCKDFELQTTVAALVHEATEKANGAAVDAMNA